MGAEPTRTGGEWIVAALAAEGVRHVFGIPGIHNLAVYDALLRQDAIVHVLARHEQGAGFMADGYARASGRPGVILATTGPGATNALTPLVEAYAGSQPVLLLMSDVPSALVGQGLGALHEVPDQIACFRPVSRWAEAIREAREIPGLVQGAFHLFRTGRPGPVALSIPTDFLGAPVAARLTPAGEGRRPPCDVRLVEEAAARLARARAPSPRGGRGRGRRRGVGGAASPGPSARRPRDHQCDGAGRDPGERSAVAGRPAEPARDPRRSRGRGCRARRRLPLRPPVHARLAPASSRSGPTRP